MHSQQMAIPFRRTRRKSPGYEKCRKLVVYGCRIKAGEVVLLAAGTSSSGACSARLARQNEEGRPAAKVTENAGLSPSVPGYKS